MADQPETRASEDQVAAQSRTDEPASQARRSRDGVSADAVPEEGVSRDEVSPDRASDVAASDVAASDVAASDDASEESSDVREQVDRREAAADVRDRTDRRDLDREDDASEGTDEPVAGPTALPKRSWLKVLRRSIREFGDDNLTDTAAALTYYAALAMFPALLVLLALIGLAGPNTTQQLIDNLGQVVPGSARDIIVQGINNLQRSPGAGLTAIIALATALWSASGYVGAFMKAANNVFDVPEGRPIWKTLPTRLAITVVMLLMMAVAAFIVVFTGPVAQQAGDALGLGSAAVTAWNILKWPVLLAIMMSMVAILYWAAPNVRHPGFRWVSPGGVVAVLLWLVASGAFAVYVGTVASYNKTYGALAGVVVFLVWIWLSNLAILLGAELDAELQRARAEAAGLPEGTEPYVDLRDTRKADLPRTAATASAGGDARR